MAPPVHGAGRSRRRRANRRRREAEENERMLMRVPRSPPYLRRRHQRQPPPLHVSLRNRYWAPDTIHWPVLTEGEARQLRAMLHNYRFKRAPNNVPAWIKMDPVERARMRQLEPPTPNIFLYGLADCCAAVMNRQCWAVIVEAKVLPRSIVLPIIDGCISNDVPMVCMNRLRNINAHNFGNYSGCLGIKNGYLPELRQYISAISNAYRAAQLNFRYNQQPVAREPSEAIVEAFFNLNPEDDSANVALPAVEGPSPAEPAEPSPAEPAEPAELAEPLPAEPLPAEPSSAEPSFSELSAPEPMSVEQPSAEPLTVEPQSAGLSTGEPSVAEPSAGPSWAGTSWAQPSSYGPSPADPSTVEPSPADPSTAEPSTAEPSTAEPSPADPATAGASFDGTSAAGPSSAGPATAGTSWPGLSMPILDDSLDDLPATADAGNVDSRAVLPPFNVFRMILRKSPRRLRERTAYLDLDTKKVVVLPE